MGFQSLKDLEGAKSDSAHNHQAQCVSEKQREFGAPGETTDNNCDSSIQDKSSIDTIGNKSNFSFFQISLMHGKELESHNGSEDQWLNNVEKIGQKAV